MGVDILSWLSMLTTIVVLAWASVATVELIRSLDYVQAQMLKGHKPWSCNLCLTTWTASYWWIIEWLGSYDAYPSVLMLVSSIGLGLISRQILDHFSAPPMPPTE